MKAYVYQAALWCETCALVVRENNESGGAITFDDMRKDSEHYPQGPYDDGGGEADCPQHCDGCGVFLENPLTDDGLEYVREAIQDWQELSQGNGAVIHVWQEFYGLAIACHVEKESRNA